MPADIALALHYLRHRAIILRKGTEPVVYFMEVEVVLEMLQAGTFQEWYTAITNTLPGFPKLK